MLQQLLDYSVLPLILFGITAIQALGLQLILGGAGLLSLGHAAFYAVGGYSAAAFTVYAAPAIGLTQPFFVMLAALAVGALSAMIAGFLVAVPCLRLQGDYLAMATLGFAEILGTALKNIDAVGGTRGFSGIPKLSSLVWVFVVLGLVWLMIARLQKTGLGMAIQATRDDEIAARSLGINTYASKLSAFVVGSSIAGLAGALYVHALQFISPDEADFSRSVIIVLAVVIGGMTSLFGSVLGALILVAVPEILRFAPDAIREQRMIYFALIVIFVMLFSPKGLQSLLVKVLPRRGQSSGRSASAGGQA
ncbi:MAG: branched-chain amino acid ABC transporter permease [Proteobacteria bacterium]|nr:branched-chain amino acid ABC transporter permease [Pseudomonadota bacterium]